MVRYRFGEPHLREVTRTRSEGARRILVLGDSFTFGWLLDDADTYVARLQELVDAEFGPGRFVLLDAAAGGWGTADYLFFLEDFGPQIRPDAVLVFVNIDDIGRSLRKPAAQGGQRRARLHRRSCCGYAFAPQAMAQHRAGLLGFTSGFLSIRTWSN